MTDTPVTVMFVGGPLNGTVRTLERLHDVVTFDAPATRPLPVGYVTDDPACYPQHYEYERSFIAIFGKILRIYLLKDIDQEAATDCLARTLLSSKARMIEHETVPDTVDDLIAQWSTGG